ncbi:hypothetical protein NIES2100_73510 [Calothrix sp. NIES-2100]|uniref:hypothetical protein n=1 Tax=Calothrix sp. NIES-2100 TaxID=1954172 RepID=UPI000B5FF618|nr:hypothetical protein NIES2100_73510 [Calothrix sp. NIES-2100]
MKKILAFSLIIFFVTPLSATARTIRMRDKTSDGATLSVFTNAEPVSQSGWTVFRYGIEKNDSYRQNIGVTPYCDKEKIQRNESVSQLNLPIPSWANAQEIKDIQQISNISNLSQLITEPGWIVNLNGTVTAIPANSPGSLSLLGSVCAVASEISEISEGLYWLGNTDQGLEIKGSAYRYYDEEASHQWRPISELKLIKNGVIYDGKNYWCLSTLIPQNQLGVCSANGWVTN